MTEDKEWIRIQKNMEHQISPESPRRVWEHIPYFMNTLKSSDSILEAYARVAGAYLDDDEKMFFGFFLGELSMEAHLTEDFERRMIRILRVVQDATHKLDMVENRERALASALGLDCDEVTSKPRGGADESEQQRVSVRHSGDAASEL